MFSRAVSIVRRPLERFLRIEAASGIVLLVATGLALGAANSPWAEAYARFWGTSFGVRFSGVTFERSLAWFVNDGLMVIFFFVVGLEIRREIDRGELSEVRRAALPIAAAFGGMAVPACVYLAFAHEPKTQAGWGAAMATDIAFAVGVLSLLGKRVPPALRVLLLALAVIDDLGAIAVIALFYSAGIRVWGLGVAFVAIAAVFLLQRLGVRAKLAYLLPAWAAWAGVYGAGIHPTIAGVVLGVITPVQRAPGESTPPADGLIDALHPWVAFGVMPVFALANAGVSLSGFVPSSASWSVTQGVASGLLLGKPLGIALFTWLALRLGLARLPLGLGARHVVVLGVVAGIGFTMSLFIAQLAFEDAALLAAVKLGVIAASTTAGILALVFGRLLLDERRVEGSALDVDEAEASTER
ncbi:MAG TPA: Na+/H+ antiporter NhaA [Polyangiaceae bacterium]